MEISLEFRLGAVFSIPLFLEENIQVKIMGYVKSPGEYLVPINSTLQDLYIIAGGIGESADDRSIFFSRESLKEKEKIALQAAKKVLIDSIISRSTSSTGGSSIWLTASINRDKRKLNQSAEFLVTLLLILNF